MRKTQLTTRTALLFALVLVLVLCLAVALSPLAQLRADAYTSEPDSTIGEIYKDNAETGGSFDQNNLQALINKLAGTSSGNTTIDELQGKIDESSTKSRTKELNDTMKIADQSIIVEFGGIKWIAVFLSLADTTHGVSGNGSKAASKDVVLTLWQAYADDSTTTKWNQYGDKADGKYPANMYDTSYMRAVILNNGGEYATGKDANLTTVEQQATNTYAKFNMTTYGSDGAKSNIHEFLVAPRYLDWQYDQNRGTMLANDIATGYINNESWGLMGKSNYYNQSYWYEEKTNYSAWQDDLIWLPSLTETGDNTRTGVWFTETTHRTSQSTETWLRSASVNYYAANSLTSDGGGTDNAVSTSEFLVRPALHLNLTAAVESLSGVDKPTGENGSNSKTVTYNGNAQTFDLGLKSEYVTDGKVTLTVTPSDGTATVADNNGAQVLSATKAGTYKVTVTPTEGNRWKNDENNDDTEPIEFTLTIEKRKVSLDVAIPQGSPTSVPYGTAYTLLDVDRYWSYASGSLEFVNGDEKYLTVTTDAANAYALPATYPLKVEFTGDDSNYAVTYNGNPEVTVTKADIILSGTFSAEYEYELDGSGSPVKRELRIAESQVTVVNGQKVIIKYGSLTASTTGYDSSDDGYAVWKVGTYYVDVTITAPNHNTLTQRISVTITKAKPTVTPLCDRSEIWTSGILPELTCTATLRNNQSVAGAISWITSLGTVRSDGYYDFYYRWVPEDQENFEIVDGNECYVRLYVRFASVTRFTVTFDPEGELFYETDSLNILKNYLTVTVTFSDGTTRTLGMNEYDLNCQGGSTLVAGDSVTVTVSYLSAGTPVERNFNVQVLAVERPPVDTPPTGDNPDPAPKDPTGDTISKAKEFFENTPLPLGYAALVLGGMLLLIIILAIAGRKPKKKD